MNITIGELKRIASYGYKLGLKEKPKFELDFYLEAKVLELKMKRVKK